MIAMKEWPPNEMVVHTIFITQIGVKKLYLTS